MPTDRLFATRVSGPPPTLACLHGFAGTGEDWLRVFEGWSEPPRRVLIDLPGHGRSPPLQQPPSFDATARRLHETARDRDAVPAVWVGYSFGGRLLWPLALKHPQDVLGLVLIAAHPGLRDESERKQRVQQDAADAMVLEEHGLDEWIRTWHERPVFDARRVKPGWNSEVAKKLATNRPRDLALTLRGLGLGAQPDFRRFLPKISVPTLLVTGSLDKPYTSLAKETASLMPNARHVGIQGSGHGAHLEDPKAFQDVLRGFLETLDARTTTRTP